MAKLDKHKMTRDLQLLSSRFALAVDIAFFSAVIYALGAGLYFSASFLRFDAYLPGFFVASGFTGLLGEILAIGACGPLPVVGFHYSRTHDGKSLPHVLQDLAKSNNKQDRQNLRKYMFSILLKGTTIIAVGDVTGIIAYKVSGTEAPLLCSISWVIGAGIAALGLYLLSWFRFPAGLQGSSERPVIRGTLVNTFEMAKTRSRTLVDRPEQPKAPGEME